MQFVLESVGNFTKPREKGAKVDWLSTRDSWQTALRRAKARFVRLEPKFLSRFLLDENMLNLEKQRLGIATSLVLH
jgi:hypothetical protein